MASRPLVERVDLELYRQLCDLVFQKKLSENQITQGATAARRAMVEHPARVKHNFTVEKWQAFVPTELDDEVDGNKNGLIYLTCKFRWELLWLLCRH